MSSPSRPPRTPGVVSRKLTVKDELRSSLTAQERAQLLRDFKSSRGHRERRRSVREEPPHSATGSPAESRSTSPTLHARSASIGEMELILADVDVDNIPASAHASSTERRGNFSGSKQTHSDTMVLSGSGVPAGTIDKRRSLQVRTGDHYRTLSGASSDISSASIRKTGSSVDFGSGSGEPVRMWKVLEEKHSDIVSQLRWIGSKQDMLCSASNDGTLRLWCPFREDPSPAELCDTDSHGITDFDYNYESDTIVSVSIDRFIRWWDVETSQLIKRIEFPSCPMCVVFRQRNSLEEEVIIGDSDGCIWLMNLKTEQRSLVRVKDCCRRFGGPKKSSPDMVSALVSSVDGEWFYSGDAGGNIQSFRLDTKSIKDASALPSGSRALPTYSMIARENQKSRITNLELISGVSARRVSRDDSLRGGSFLVVNGCDSKIKIYCLPLLRLLRVVFHPQMTYALRSSYCGSAGQLIAGDENGMISIYDVVSGEQLVHISSGCAVVTCVRIVSIGDDRYLASGCDDGTVRLWNVDASIEVPSFDNIDVR